MGPADRATLERALERILPGRDETLLLRAILHRGDEAREAWEDFQGRLPDLPSLFRTDTGNRKRLSPLLLESIRENGLDADAPLRTVIKTATLREQLRSDIYRRIGGDVFDALGRRGFEFVVIRGAALAETAYAAPFLRHAHDIDVVLMPERIRDAAAVVRELGFADAPPLDRAQGVDLRHGTELPVLLLSRLHRLPFYRGHLGDGGLRTRRVEGPGTGAMTVLDPVDALVHALGHASYSPTRSNLLWAVDAWMLIHGTPALEWSAVPARARDMRVELPLSVLLGYLARDLGAPVPPPILTELGAAHEGSGADGGLRRDVALFGARQSGGAHPELSGRPPLTPAQRLTLLRWELWPSRAYVSWVYDDPPAALLPLLYLVRPFSAALERIRWRLARLRNRWFRRPPVESPSG